MMECILDNHSTIMKRIVCILSYSGSEEDIVINYTLLTISLCSILASHYQNLHEKTIQIGQFECFAFVGVLVFQIGLCLVLSCSGISIVWGTLLGFMLAEMGFITFYATDNTYHNSRWNDTSNVAIRISIAGSSLGVIYYAIYAPIITTVAHILAIILGAGKALLMIFDTMTYPILNLISFEGISYWSYLKKRKNSSHHEHIRNESTSLLCNERR